MAILCPYRNVLPEAVCCCFTRTTLFSKSFTCLYDQRILQMYGILQMYIQRGGSPFVIVRV